MSRLPVQRTRLQGLLQSLATAMVALLRRSWPASTRRGALISRPGERTHG